MQGLSLRCCISGGARVIRFAARLEQGALLDIYGIPASYLLPAVVGQSLPLSEAEGSVRTTRAFLNNLSYLFPITKLTVLDWL
jgi:hypothetical protein